MKYKTADRLSRHLSAVLRKIRETIGNSLASKRPLLRSSSLLACAGNFPSNFENAEKPPWQTTARSLPNLRDTFSRGACVCPHVRPCGPPHPPVVPVASLRAPGRAPSAEAAMHPLRGSVRLLNIPSESPPSPSGKAVMCAPLRRWSHLRHPDPTMTRRSTLWENPGA
ncbi:hypothetical protein HMPREF9161_01402 [Selenomonas sp. F0473]|nr:hypothetical protein HMPREF9161_01402 [Selenomonas sp. F0473]